MRRPKIDMGLARAIADALASEDARKAVFIILEALGVSQEGGAARRTTKRTRQVRKGRKPRKPRTLKGTDTAGAETAPPNGGGQP